MWRHVHYRRWQYTTAVATDHRRWCGCHGQRHSPKASNVNFCWGVEVMKSKPVFFFFLLIQKIIQSVVWSEPRVLWSVTPLLITSGWYKTADSFRVLSHLVRLPGPNQSSFGLPSPAPAGLFILVYLGPKHSSFASSSQQLVTPLLRNDGQRRRQQNA